MDNPPAGTREQGTRADGHGQYLCHRAGHPDSARLAGAIFAAGRCPVALGRVLTKPSRPHFLQKCFSDLQAGGITENAVNATRRAQGRLLRARLVGVSPIDDLIWTKDVLAIEAAASLATFNFCMVRDAVLVSDAERMVLR